MPSIRTTARIRRVTNRAKNPNAKYKIVIKTSDVYHTVNGQVVQNTSTTTREIVPKDDSN